MTLEWGYKRAFLRCALLFVVGTTLQFIVGEFDNSFMRHPWGLVLAINYLYLLVVGYTQSKRWRWLHTLYDHSAGVAALGSMVLMCIIFGLTRQDGSSEGLLGALGFHSMTSSWAFILLMLNFLTALGMATIDDLAHLRSRRVSGVLSHAAIFVAVGAMLFGSGDKQRVTINAVLDMPVYQGVNREGERVDLPFAVTLREFKMEEYEPRLYMLNYRDESSSEEYLSVEGDGYVGELEGWSVEVLANYDMAARLGEEQEYRSMQHVGACSAVKLRARNLLSGESREGWVSCGSHIFEPSYLILDDKHALAMPRREAKSYLSRVVVEDRERQDKFDIRVNHPAKRGAWRIYQVGYDTSRGRWSTYSVLECVHDGWSDLVKVALWLALLSGVVMFLTAGGKRSGAVECDKSKEKQSL